MYLPSRLVSLVVLAIFSILTADSSVAQPFAVPAPNIPGNATGIDPSVQVAFGAIEWGDYNADSHIDFVITGRLESVAGGFLPIFGAIYRNIRVDFNDFPPPPPRFDFIRGSLIDPVWLSDSSWEDIDGDGDLDLAIIGASSLDPPYAPTGVIYEFVPSGQIGRFDPVFEFEGLHSGSVAWGDYDNDGDADLLATGLDAKGEPTIKLFSNDELTFIEQTIPFSPVAYGDAQFVDIDGDYDLDVALTGMKVGGAFVTELYRNNGTGNFSLISDELPGGIFSSMDWGDFDADGDQDMILSAGVLAPLSVVGKTTVFINDGTGQLTDSGAALTKAYYGETSWIDYDRDGDLDAIASGLNHPFSSPSTLIQENTGGLFNAISINTAGLGASPVDGLRYSMSSWADFDEDGDLDLLIAGEDFAGEYFTKLYGNIGAIPPNQPPAPPTAGAAVVAGSSVTFSWSAGSDNETPSSALTYNLRVGTTPGGIDVLAPLSLPGGKRLVVRPGNTGSNTGWRLEGLPPGVYYWSAQSVDTDMVGSSFSAEQTFVIN